MSYAMVEPGMNLLTCCLVNKWRKQNGLRRWKMTDDYRIQNGKKVLTFYPVTPILMSKDPKWKEHIQVRGYWYHPEEDARKYVPDSDLMSFLKEGEKPIFICFGKAESDELAKLQYLTLEALKKTKLRAVVHHGGNTTNGLGLWAGLPTLVIPLALDQYFYGRAIYENGCGPKPLYIRKKMCSQEQIEKALLELADGRYEQRAKEG